MNKLNKIALSVLGIVVAAGNVNAATSHGNGRDSQEAAQAIASLIDAGYIKVDSKTGEVILQKSILDTLKENGAVEIRNYSKQDETQSEGGGGGMVGP